MDTSPLAPSTGPQIRSRITVVCAECKRLKLKCDRRTPCGSCTKRDTVARCIYSPAAAEKVDLHSLNNRLLQVEAALAQLTAGPSSSPYNSSYSNSPSNPHNGSALAVCNSGSSLVISIQDVLSIWLAELDINYSVLPTPTQLSSPPSSHVKLEPSHTSVPFERHILDPPTGSSTPSPTLSLPPLSIYYLPSPFPSHASSSAQQPRITPQLLALLPPLSTLDAVASIMALHPCFNWRHFRDRVRRLLKFPPNADGAREREMQRERPKSNEKNTKADTARAIFFGPPRPATRTPVVPPSSSKDKVRDREKCPSYDSQPTISFFASAAAAFALGVLVSSYGSMFGEPNQGEMPMIIDFVDGATGANAGGAKTKKVRAKQPAPPRLSTSSIPSTSKASGRKPSMHLSGSCSQSGPGSESCPESDLGSPAFLFALSMQALSVHEMSGAHFDVDYLQACVLQALFLLHCGCDEMASKGGSGEAEGERNGEESGNVKGKGREMLSGAIFPLVGKMVNIARQMGLGMDPDEFPERYNLFDAETRRRLWWDVYYYDLFVSDCMGHPPLIQDGSFSTKMAADADEDVFSPASVSVPLPAPMRRGAGDGVVDGWCPTGFKYFELKCRLAQLVKTMRRRTYKDPSSDPRELAYTLEQAAGFEMEIRQWLAELPQPFWLDMSAADGFRGAGDGNEISPLNMSTSPMVSPSSTTTSPILVAHQCELAITANRLILKLYLPFLRPGACNNAFPPHQASHGTVNAAHVIIHASKVLYSGWKQHYYRQHHYYADEPMLTLTPAMFRFYSFGRTLFDAAVVCAHAAIKQPMTVWAGVALADVGAALDVMRDPIVADAGSRGGAGMDDEAVRVVGILQRKAEAARSGGGAAAAGMKRKHDEVEAGLAGFRLSSYGAPAATSVSGRGSPVHPRQRHHPQSDTVNADVPFPNPPHKFETAQMVTPVANDGREDGREKTHSGKHPKKAQYPSVGVRVRPGKEGSPLVRDRHRSSSTATTGTTGSNESRLYAPAPPPSLPSSRGPLTTQPRTPVLEDSNYHHHPSHGLQQDSNQDVYRRSSLAQDIPMQQPESANPNGPVDYSTFGAGDDVQMDMNNLPRRRYSIHELQQQQQQPNFPPDHPPTFDQPHPGTLDHPPLNTFGPDSHGSMDRPCAESYVSASSPYASRQETGSSSGLISSASSPYTSTGAAPSLLSTPTFGHNPSPPTFGHQQLHASPASYAPSPLANPNTHSFYMGSGYDSQYNNTGIELGMDDNGHNVGSAMVDGPLYDKSHQIMYDVKASDGHPLRNEQSFQANPGHMPSHNNGPPPPTWSRENGPAPQGEYWW